MERYRCDLCATLTGLIVKFCRKCCGGMCEECFKKYGKTDSESSKIEHKDDKACKASLQQICVKCGRKDKQTNDALCYNCKYVLGYYHTGYKPSQQTSYQTNYKPSQQTSHQTNYQPSQQTSHQVSHQIDYQKLTDTRICDECGQLKTDLEFYRESDSTCADCKDIMNPPAKTKVCVKCYKAKNTSEFISSSNNTCKTCGTMTNTTNSCNQQFFCTSCRTYRNRNMRIECKTDSCLKIICTYCTDVDGYCTECSVDFDSWNDNNSLIKCYEEDPPIPDGKKEITVYQPPTVKFSDPLGSILSTPTQKNASYISALNKMKNDSKYASCATDIALELDTAAKRTITETDKAAFTRRIEYRLSVPNQAVSSEKCTTIEQLADRLDKLVAVMDKLVDKIKDIPYALEEVKSICETNACEVDDIKRSIIDINDKTDNVNNKIDQAMSFATESLM